MRVALLLLALLAPQPLDADLSPDAAGLAAAFHGRVWHDETPLTDRSFQMTCIIEELDRRGAAKKRLVLEHRREFKAGRMIETLVSAHENGRDVTDRQRKAETRPERRGLDGTWSIDEALAPPLPFLAYPGAYRLSLSEGGSALAYVPLPGRANHRMARGMVTLDPGDHLPVLHRFIPEPLPSLIRRLETSVRYGRLEGLAIPEETLTEGEGGFLFIRKRFRITMRYRDMNPGRTPHDASAQSTSNRPLMSLQ
jgi:hypothetical protein